MKGNQLERWKLRKEEVLNGKFVVETDKVSTNWIECCYLRIEIETIKETGGSVGLVPGVTLPKGSTLVRQTLRATLKVLQSV